ncbi:MAG: 3-deoxy-D-manno-octulosonate cytidylyltransferase [Leptospirillum sp. Group IV 'UBA BS']|nr:MAG: 3-deoxy-D-manno-octulosonate cytidylyltransferase [Leptospirillum sp. Group IV 'UBA BS']
MPASSLPMEETESDVVVVIPARMASTRFPGKPLAQVNGIPLVIHVAQMARKSEVVDRVIIATDSPEILSEAGKHGFEAVLTSGGAHTGSDRVAEVAKTLSAQIVVNLQADEIMGDPRIIDQAVEPLFRDERLPMATVRRILSDPSEIRNTNIVKVVCNQRNLALYFSRSPIPMDRDGIGPARPDLRWDQHLGIYAFRKAALLEFARLPVSPLEELEKLEQLRALDYGFAIYVARTDLPSWRVDSPEDLALFAKTFSGVKA